jgi:capsular exopolysaccharide synthesis family protein
LISIFSFWIIIFFKEAFRKKIEEKKTIEDLLALSIIGEITFKNKNESQIIEHNKRSLLAEEFRKIRISLNFLGVNKSKNKILITSSIPGEGKSFVAINLAISNAMTGKKVILIDCDLHKSGLEEIFKLNNQYLGMSEFLIGECDLNEIISKVEWQENLYFIPAGKNKINGSELLLNKRLKEMISELENDFDLILIDSAPSILITDAFILSEICDCTLFIVRHQFTTMNIMKKMAEILKINPLKNVGVVFNGIKRNKYLSINNEYTKYYMKEIKENENKNYLSISNN